MKKNVFEIYCYLVCLLTLMCGIVVLGLFSYNTIRFINPEFTLSEREVKTYSSNQAYREAKRDQERRFTNRDQQPEPSKLDSTDEETISKMRTEEYTTEIKLEKRTGLQNIVRQGIILLIDIFVFFIHWKMGRKEKQSVE